MGLKNFLSHLMEDDSTHPGESDPVQPHPATADDSASAQAGASHPVVGVLARTLRALGDGAFEMEDDLKTRYLALAEQVETGDPTAWSRIPGKVAEQRKAEKTWVSRNLRELAETVVGLVTRLGRNVSLDRDSDRQMGGQLDRLRSAVKTENMPEMRREVLGAVETLSTVMKLRDDRQRMEMAAVSRELEHLKTELSSARKEMAIDPLTRLYNRTSFDDHVKTTMALSTLAGRESCLLMVDIDHFKNVNDTYGHQAGDAVLKIVSGELAKCFPRKTDFTARYGGEEFAVVLSEDGETIGVTLAQRLLGKIRDAVILWEGVEVRVTVSVGVAEIGAGQTTEDWISVADQRLYQAKHSGRDRVVGGEPPEAAG